MFVVVLTHIEADGNDYTRVISKHRTRSAAIKSMLKTMASYYGWPNTKEFKEEFKDDYEETIKTGNCKVEPYKGFFSFWSVIEV